MAAGHGGSAVDPTDVNGGSNGNRSSSSVVTGFDSLDTRAQTFLRNLITCVNCKEACLSPQIYQCNTGHLSCANCFIGWFPECKRCGTRVWASSRNRLAESIAAVVDVTCPNKSRGCGLIMKPRTVDAHLLDCFYGKNYFCYKLFRCRPSPAGVDLCRMSMKDKNHLNTNFIQHLQNLHHLTGSTTGNLSINLNATMEHFGFGNRYEHLHFLQFDERVFILKTKLNWFRKEISFATMILGSSDAAKKYRVRIDSIFGPAPTSVTSVIGDPDLGCKIHWEGCVVGFDARSKVNSIQKFALPWSTFKAQKKRFEVEKLDWVVHAEMKAATPACSRPAY